MIKIWQNTIPNEIHGWHKTESKVLTIYYFCTTMRNRTCLFRTSTHYLLCKTTKINRHCFLFIFFFVFPPEGSHDGFGNGMVAKNEIDSIAAVTREIQQWPRPVKPYGRQRFDPARISCRRLCQTRKPNETDRPNQQIVTTTTITVLGATIHKTARYR